VNGRLTRRRLIALAGAGAAAAVLPSDRPIVLGAGPAPTRVVLPNGLTAIVLERPTADNVALRLVARVGTRDDGAEGGIALLAGRMMFQGTPTRPSETAIQRAIAAVGGTITRGADLESSIISCVVPAVELDLALDVVSDVVRRPLLDATVFARQQQVAIQDLAARATQPATRLGDLYQATAFAGHPLASLPLGTADTLRSLTADAIRRHHAREYAAANLVLAVVGRVHTAELMTKIERSFGGQSAGARHERRPVPVPPLRAANVRSPSGEQQATFRLGFRAPALSDPDRPAFTVLNATTSSATGLLFKELRTARGLAYSAGSDFQPFTDAGGYFAGAGVDPDKVDLAVGITKTQLSSLRDRTFDRSYIEAVAQTAAYREVLATETNAAQAERLTRPDVLGPPPADAVIEAMRRVSPDDVQRVARTYLDMDSAVLVVVGAS